jgi:hypothetical protein
VSFVSDIALSSSVVVVVAMVVGTPSSVTSNTCLSAG